MFFLGLLSSPIPYMLLAGFYFLGFVAGMFKSDPVAPDNAALPVVSIQADIQEKITEKNTIYLQIHKATPKLVKSRLPEIQISALHFNHCCFITIRGQEGEQRHCDPEFTNILFSRPPPACSI